MNFAELRTAFYDYVDDEAKDLHKTDKVARLINASMRMLARKLEHVDEWYFVKCVLYAVTVSSTDLLFPFPEDFKRVKTAERLFDDNTDPIPVNWVQFQDRNSFETWPPHKLRTFSRPACYMHGSNLGVVTPNEAYTLRLWYSNVVTKLLDEGDTPEGFPADHHDTIALQAAKLAYAIEERPFPFIDEYQEGVRDLMTTTQQRQRQQPRFVHPVDFHGGH